MVAVYNEHYDSDGHQQYLKSPTGVTNQTVDFDGTKNWSLSGFMQLADNYTDANGLFFTYLLNSTVTWFRMELSSAGIIKLSVRVSGNDPYIEYQIPSYTASDQKWINWCITHSTRTDNLSEFYDNLNLYVNGVKVTASNQSGASADLTTGAIMDPGSVSEYIIDNSSIDATYSDHTIWDKELSESEVSSLIWNGGKPKNLTSHISTDSTPGLKNWYWMGDGYDLSNTSNVDSIHGTTKYIYDMTGNGMHLVPERNGTTTWSGNGDATRPTGVLNLTSSTPDQNMKVSFTGDIFHSKMGADKPFSINTWFNSSNAPDVTANEIFGVTKYLDCNNETNKSASFEQRMRTDSIFWDSSASATLFKPNGNWSISFWFKYTDSDTYGIIWDMRNPDDANKRIILYTGNSGSYLYLFARHGSGSDYAQINYGSTARALLLDGSWHHVVITNAASSSSTNGTVGSTTSNMKLWIDGVCKDASYTATMGNWTTTADNLRMTFGHSGSESLSMNNYYPMDHGLSNVSTWTVDLGSDISGTSSAKISALYNSGDPTDLANETGLLNWFRCGDTAGDNLYDASDATNAYLRDSKGTAKLIPETTTNGTTFSQGWSNTSYGTLADASSETIAVATTYSYTDNYLPVLFNNGAKNTVPAVPSNTKYTELTGTTTNYKIEMGAQADFNDGGDNFWFDRRTSTFTISWWMNVPSITTSTIHDIVFSPGHAYDTSPGVGQWKGFQVSFRQSKLWLWWLSSGSSYGYLDYTTTNLGISTDAWHHYTVTYDGPQLILDAADGLSGPDIVNNMKLYVDGSLVTPSAQVTSSTWLDDTTSDTSSTGEFRLGYPANGYHQGQVGKYDEVAIWKKVLTATQIQDDLYNSGNFKDLSTIESSDLKRYYRFENSDGTDSAGKHTGTVGSSVTFGNLSSGDSFYAAGAAAYDVFGNGLTASFTKKLGSGTTWNPAGTETTKLLLSFDGFEDASDAFNAYDASSLLDGNWHNLQLTWDGSSTDTEDVKVFADGVELSISDSGNNKLNKTAADKHFKYTTGTFVPGTFGASGWGETASTDSIYAFQGALDNLSLHSEVTTLAKAQEFYGKNGSFEGKPHNYQMSNTLTYSNVEGWWTFDEAGDSITVANDRTSNNIDLTLNNFVSGGNGLVTMTSSDSTYLVNPVKGEGLTLSMTKNLKDDGTWVKSQDQTARLILSFNGFESDAEHWVAYNTTQTIGSTTINLLDGRWHSVTLSYQGTTAHAGTALSENEIRYGKTQVGGSNQPFHFVVSYDGQSLEDIVGTGSVSGYNLSKEGETGFVIQNKHLRHENSAAEYVPTTYLASGFVETNITDSIYAFQGGFDESSFHSDNWWSSTTNYNGEKPLTIYGITFAVAAEYQNRKKPYNLRQPSSAGVTTTTQDQYINPNPYDASTNPGGGMEVYYRWGDTLNDCSESVKDVRGHEGNPKITDRDITAINMQHTDTDALATSDSGSGTLYSRDITADGITMYVAPASETTEGGLQSNIVQISGCAPSSIQQHIIKGPKLAHMRVKWSGAGSCDLGEDKCRAKLWFRRRKK
tara:strand:- start:1586 stop:6235 length:4650 start_codon:yes stop_codon:yes gene_type:complete